MIFTCVFTHPACLAASLAGSFAFSVYLNRRKAVRFGLVFLLPMLIVTALINPAFNHQGGTIITYLRDGNPLTLESIIYGIAAAVMLISVINWFSCFNAVVTSDKFVYLFGRVIPALSLILSMSLRLAPRFKAQIKIISAAQKCIGRDMSDGNVLRRARNGIRILSIMATWALENAIETADSMKSRGYGLKGRTAFSIYRFTKRDRAALVFIAACSLYTAAGAASGSLYFRYFPTIKANAPGVFPFSIYLAYFALCVSPAVFGIIEDGKWKALESKA
jgi:energy-coupling factor transport system permease protein